MVTLVFRCPRCRTDCICGVTSEEEAFAFCAGVPIQLACWVCGTHSLVVHRSAWAMLKEARPEHFFGECLKRAAECRCEAVRAQEEATRRRLLRLESCWLSLGRRIVVWDAVVAARRARVRTAPEPPARERQVDLVR